MTKTKLVVPKVGPEPLLLSRKEIDVLYEIFNVVLKALALLKVEYIVTGGSLLGAIRQHSILFCDDDIDIAIIDDIYNDNNESTLSIYDSVIVPRLQAALDAVTTNEDSGDDKYVYQVKPWQGGDRVRSKRFNNVFLDLFVLRKYPTKKYFLSVIGVKFNGEEQPESYVESILDTIHKSIKNNDDTDNDNTGDDSLFPFWHFSTRKAIELWPKEVYRAAQPERGVADELFPLQKELKFGPLTRVCGPNMPVTLLKRAFGNDCFEVYYRSISHMQTMKQKQQHTMKEGKNSNLPPLVKPGGTWENNQKVKLDNEHYLPMQPLARRKRRPTTTDHCKLSLLEFLKIQTKKEEEEKRMMKFAIANKSRRTVVYMDGVFDLFHIGHLEAIKQCAALGDYVILGVTGDIDATEYKRKPIVPQAERVAIVSSLKQVNQVICPCPLIVTKEFIETHQIDWVVHGFANDKDAEKQQKFFGVAMKCGKFKRIEYYRGMSTTDRIRIIQEESKLPYNHTIEEQENEIELSSFDDTNNSSSRRKVSKPQWFGATLANATNNATMIPTDPFPLNLRNVIEPHINKARKKRQDALHAIRMATGESIYDSVMQQFIQKQQLPHKIKSSEMIDDHYYNRLVKSFFLSAGLPLKTDLSKLHEQPVVDGRTAKDRLLYALTQNPTPFQKAYDAYVRRICFSFMDCEEIYFQAFPCLRIIQPNEFSIGPHADVSYGHHPCSINCYVSLTNEPANASSSSSLFVESRPGSEDWHVLNTKTKVNLFAGAINMHWTTENKTCFTRVSLDFRLLDGRSYSTLKCGGHLPGGKIDVYRNEPGYYTRCIKKQSKECLFDIDRDDHELIPPDFRVGFPWTVKNWDKFWKKKRNNSTFIS